MFKGIRKNKDVVTTHEDLGALYLVGVGLELSDLLEINGINILTPRYSNNHSKDVHGFYTFAPRQDEKRLLIHVQGYTALSPDPSWPIVASWLREAPESFNYWELEADKTDRLATLLEQDYYGTPGSAANHIVEAYQKYKQQ